MGFKEFMGEVRSRGVAARSHYIVELTPPSFLMTSSEALKIIPFFCEQAMFPEFVLPTQTIKDGGINREVVYDKLYGQLSMTFMCDQQMIIKEFFDKWAQAPVKDVGGIFMYPEKYIIPEMKIYQLDDMKQQVYCVTVNKVYPKTINDVLMSAADRAITSFQVVFAYETWASERYSVDMKVPPPAPQTAAMDYNSVVRGKPKFMTDIAQILDYAVLGKEGAKSALITRGTMAITDILSKGRTSPTVGGVPGLDLIKNIPSSLPVTGIIR